MRPWKCTVPDDGRIRPASMRSVVVLPAPFGPTSAKISPARTSNDTSSTATRGPNVLVSESACSMRPLARELVAARRHEYGAAAAEGEARGTDEARAIELHG